MKKILLYIILMAASLSLRSQVPDSTALVIIDIQQFYFPGGSVPLENPEAAAEKAAGLLAWFRDSHKPVVHVGHISRSGSEFHPLVQPVPGEKVIMKKEVNAFLNTDLEQFLRANHIKNLVLCGMQTHMCLEGATRAAHDLGFSCTVAADACATRDLTWGETTVKAVDVHAATMAALKSYAVVKNVDTILVNFHGK